MSAQRPMRFPPAYFLCRSLPVFFLLVFTGGLWAQNSHPKFRVIALAEKGGIHKPFVDAAKSMAGPGGHCRQFFDRLH